MIEALTNGNQETKSDFPVPQSASPFKVAYLASSWLWALRRGTTFRHET